MKFNGESLLNCSSTLFTLKRGDAEPLVLRLHPLSLGFHQRLKARGFHAPVPPVKIARDAAGKPLRDAQGMVLTLADQQAPEFQTAVDRYHQHVAVLSVVEALQADPHVQFDAVAPDTESAADWQRYADRLFLELEEAGFVAGDLILLCREIYRLSNLIDDHLQSARKNFSPSPLNNPD